MKTYLRAFLKQHDVTIFFILVFVCTWLHTIPEIAVSQGLLAHPPAPAISLVLQVLGILGGPAGAALLVVAITHGKTGLKEWIRPLSRWRVGLQWYAVVLFSYLIIALVSFGGAQLLTGGAGPSLLESMQARLAEMRTGLGLSSAPLWLTFLVLLVYSMVVVPLYEELGWRGFALPRLQEKHSALSAGLVIGSIWAVWHLPNFFIRGAPQEGMPFIGFFLEIVAFSILLVWVYNNTHGSLLMPFLWHGAIIVTSIFVPVLPLATRGDLLPFWISVGLTVGCAIVVVLVTDPARLVRRSSIMQPGNSAT